MGVGGQPLSVRQDDTAVFREIKMAGFPHSLIYR